MGDLRVPDLNKVFLAGRLTRDPELKYTSAGQPYCRVGVANTRYYRDKAGGRQEISTFVDVVVWGQMAEFVGQRLNRGRAVLVEGRLQTSEWTDQEGQKRSRLEINAERVSPLEWEDRGGASSPAPPAEPSSAHREPVVPEDPQPEDDIPF
ncbi:MAG TPA: single-stranded DNA-binding protein [Candidatus Hydrogenedentes bacterium]|nr:single-stranded DNA-binding protein [Candidatus Hydrogenedentota bacterium]